MSTNENLKEAFAGESQAHQKYLSFAKKAESEGYPQVAKLFRAAAAAESVHAHAHFRALGNINSTAENIDEAINGEAHEFKTMYPEFLEQAKKDENKPAIKSFEYALAVEEVHHGLYSEAAEAVKAEKDLPQSTIQVCPVCGNTFTGDAPNPCPVCQTPKDRFFEVK